MQWELLKLSSFKIKKTKHADVKILANVTWKIQDLMPVRWVPASMLLTVMLNYSQGKG